MAKTGNLKPDFTAKSIGIHFFKFEDMFRRYRDNENLKKHVGHMDTLNFSKSSLLTGLERIPNIYSRLDGVKEDWLQLLKDCTNFDKKSLAAFNVVLDTISRKLFLVTTIRWRNFKGTSLSLFYFLW